MADDDNTLSFTAPLSSLKRPSVEGWRLTELAFNRLLGALSNDPNEAAERYELLRRKLIRFCETNRGVPPEEAADEVINRVARKIEEGASIANLFSYAYGVAKLVMKELWREHERIRRIAEGGPTSTEPAPVVSHTEDVRLNCLDSCLEKLSKENQQLIFDYYQEERHEKIELRRAMADRLQIPLNALRIRMHRLRRIVEDCMKSCLAAAS